MQIKNLGNFMDRFQAAMNIHQPDWFISFANEQELKDYARALQTIRDGKHSNTAAELALKRNVAHRLTMPLRAAVHAGLVESKVD